MIPRSIHALSLLFLSACSVSPPKVAGVAEPEENPAAYTDTDGDSIFDKHEGSDDPDGDGLPNWRDDDSDGDTVPDAIEAGDGDLATLPFDADNDGQPNFLDLDSDDNCIGDGVEARLGDDGIADADTDGVADPYDLDNDGDGIPDIAEIGSDCAKPDSDGDAVPDHLDIDSDGDGIGDRFEAGTTAYSSEPQDTDGDGTPDYLDLDSDNDGIPDADEGGVSSPTDPPTDTDGDGAPDAADTDSDGDAVSDWDELHTHGTDPYDADTDGDGFSDGGEVAVGADPMDPGVGIDGVYIEVPERSQVEGVFEFTPEIQRGDVAFLLDTTCSMSATANAMAEEFSAIVQDITALIPDTQTGFATYDDYAMAPFGSASTGDRPFILRQQVTDNRDAVQTAMAAVDIHSGYDTPESTMEAIYQGIMGDGYDQNCNGVYEASTDVLPFIADPGDAFSGTAGQSYQSDSSGGGTIGGFGFREHALPVIVYATDNRLRDADDDQFETPGGCPLDAGQADVVGGLATHGAYVIGINTRELNTVGRTQMQTLAAATGSYGDTDGDGAADNLLVFDWSGASSTSAEFRDIVVEAIDDLVEAIAFDSISLEIEGDEWGFVTDISPEAYTDVSRDEVPGPLDFALTFRGVEASTLDDQLFNLTLNVVANDTILLDSLDIIVVVPGSTL